MRRQYDDDLVSEEEAEVRLALAQDDLAAEAEVEVDDEAHPEVVDLVAEEVALVDDLDDLVVDDEAHPEADDEADDLVALSDLLFLSMHTIVSSKKVRF